MEKEKAREKDKEDQPRLQQREETKKMKAPKAESYSDMIAFMNFYNGDARGKREINRPSSSRNKVALRLEERWQQQDESPKVNPKELDRPQRRTLPVVDCAERRPAVT